MSVGAKNRGVLAWAPCTKSGQVLRDLRGHFAVYTYRKDADQDCPSYGVVRRVRVRVIEGAKK
jgi:hypothetical protein